MLTNCPTCGLPLSFKERLQVKGSLFLIGKSPAFLMPPNVAKVLKTILSNYPRPVRRSRLMYSTGLSEKACYYALSRARKSLLAIGYSISKGNKAGYQIVKVRQAASEQQSEPRLD